MDHNEEHVHPDVMSRNSAGEAVQLGPDGKFSRGLTFKRLAWIAAGAAVTLWLVVQAFAVTAMPLDKDGHATEAIAHKAVAVCVVGAVLILLAIVASGILIGGSGRKFRSWKMTLLFVALWVVAAVIAGACMNAVHLLTQAWTTYSS
jgi:hypothetical protein